MTPEIYSPSLTGCQSSRFMTHPLSYCKVWVCFKTQTLHALSSCQSNTFVTLVIYDVCFLLSKCQTNRSVTLCVTLNGLGMGQTACPCQDPRWGVGHVLFVFPHNRQIVSCSGVYACLKFVLSGDVCCFFYELLCFTTLTCHF